MHMREDEKIHGVEEGITDVDMVEYEGEDVSEDVGKSDDVGGAILLQDEIDRPRCHLKLLIVGDTKSKYTLIISHHVRDPPCRKRVSTSEHVLVWSTQG